MLDGLEVPLPGGRKSGIDDDSWAQSPVLPGMIDKLRMPRVIISASF